MKKLLAILLSVLLLTACLPLGALSVAAAKSGTTGDCTWVLDGTHLTISGNGAMGNYDARREGNVWRTTAPWGWDVASVTIEEGVTTIGDYAIYWMPALTSVTIPDSVTTIGDHAFCVCRVLESVTIGNGVTTIGPNAFTNCDSLTSVIIPDSVTTIQDEAFGSCDSLASVAIGNNVTTIGNSVFYECGSLTSVTIPDSVTAIGKKAFFSCVSLASVTIPDSVTTIGDYAFGNCDSFATVHYHGTKADKAAISIGSDNADFTDATWHYYDDADDAECNDCGWRRDGANVPEDAAYYGGNAYKLFDLGGTWQEAKSYCESLGGHLATLTSADEDRFVYDYIVSCGYDSAYFGLYRDGGVWRWCTDEPVEYLHWADGEPNNEDADEYYGMYYFLFGDGAWNDGANFDDTAAFICEWDGVAPAPAVTLGDVNGDGRVNNKDLGLLQQHLAEWEVTLDLAAADTNGDGRVNNKDLGLLQQYLAEWDVTFG